jgi:NADPH2:quinone reductase
MISQQKTSYAIQIANYGPPEVLTYSDVVLAPLSAREVRIRTIAAAVNRTDLEIRAGHWPVRKPDPFPYVPGVEVVGVIEEIGESVREWALGQTVITMMQGLGGVRAERPGSYAEFVTVDADALAGIPPEIDPVHLAAFGLVGVTAYQGLKKIGPLHQKRILVTGAAGGVGSAATAIARAQGATVIGLVSRADQAGYVRALGADDVVVSSKGGAPALEVESFDGVLDAVAGDLFGRCVSALRPGGVLSLVGAAAGSGVTFDAWQLIRPVTLTGYSTECLDGQALRESIAALSGWIATDAVRPPDYQIMRLADAGRAHRLMEQGRVKGRVLLMPSQPGAS